ncbi:hypothetical protein BC629DRAFT_1446735 [Irpex lacteus]|nr:hypothetical protein BC629DRAFT_1446735 [Irpex lacteus]
MYTDLVMSTHRYIAHALVTHYPIPSVQLQKPPQLLRVAVVVTAVGSDLRGGLLTHWEPLGLAGDDLYVALELVFASQNHQELDDCVQWLRRKVVYKFEVDVTRG